MRKLSYMVFAMMVMCSLLSAELPITKALLEAYPKRPERTRLDYRENIINVEVSKNGSGDVVLGFPMFDIQKDNIGKPTMIIGYDPSTKSKIRIEMSNYDSEKDERIFKCHVVIGNQTFSTSIFKGPNKCSSIISDDDFSILGAFYFEEEPDVLLSVVFFSHRGGGASWAKLLAVE